MATGTAKIIHWRGQTKTMAPGMYRLRHVHGGQPQIIVSCGYCGAEGILHHQVSKDGTVSPAITCPRECGWHVWATLDRWDEL